MKAYGLPRYLDLEYPDCSDICRYGLKSAYGGGRRLKTKRAHRRIWKKKQRIENKKLTRV